MGFKWNSRCKAVTSFEPVAHCQNVGSIRCMFISYIASYRVDLELGSLLIFKVLLIQNQTVYSSLNARSECLVL